MSMYQPTDLFANRYLLLEKIGVGGFSEVWKVEDQMAENSVVAIKIYAPERGMDEFGIKQFRREYAVVLNLNHQNLLTARHFDVFNGSPYLVMPFIEGGSVYIDLMENGNWTELKMAHLIAQMGDALHFLHENEVLHQDIKPDNILIDQQGKYLLTDFGISSRLRSTLRKSTSTRKSMTVAYAPPERFDGSQVAQEAGDIFSLGVLLYELSVGDVPWMGAGGIVVKPETNPVKLPEAYSKEFQLLVQSCLRYDPTHRPKAETLQNWASEFIEKGAWPEFTHEPSPPKKSLSNERLTKQFDDTNAKPIINLQERENVNITSSSIKQEKKTSNIISKKKKKRTGLIITSIALVVTAISAYFFMDENRQSEIIIPIDTNQLAYDSLMHRGDSLLALPDLLAAKVAYEAALLLKPEDSATRSLLTRYDKILADMEAVGTISIPEYPKAQTLDDIKIGGSKLTGQVTSTNEKYSYKGSVKNGRANGYGAGLGEDEDEWYYEGDWVNGNREGNGTIQYSAVLWYSGEWKNDQMNGIGTKIWANGDEYIGWFKNGTFEGHGKFTSYDGNFFEGNFKDGRSHGYGTLHLASGNSLDDCPNCTKYQGDWDNGNMHGFGRCYDKNGKLLYEGQFDQGKPMEKYPNR